MPRRLLVTRPDESLDLIEAPAPSGPDTTRSAPPTPQIVRRSASSTNAFACRNAAVRSGPVRIESP